MDASKEYLKEKGIYPRISFKDKLVHTVTLLKDKTEQITDMNGELLNGIKFLVEENGEKKSFFTASPSLIEKLSGFKAGDTVSIKMKSVKGKQGNPISVYVVTAKTDGVESGDEAPTIEEKGGDFKIEEDPLAEDEPPF